jgi:integrase
MSGADCGRLQGWLGYAHRARQAYPNRAGGGCQAGRGALSDYVHVRGEAPGLSYPNLETGALTQDELTDQGMYYVLGRCGAQVGAARVTPHDLRPTFAGDLLGSV